MKKCSICKKKKNRKSFRKNKSRYDGLQTRCRVCDKKYQKEWYKKNKKRIINKTKTQKVERRKISQKYIIDYLKTHHCVDCGEQDPIVLEFDHVRGKKSMGIAVIVGGGYLLETLIKEIKKCDVRCANCHRRKTAKQFNWNVHC